MSKTPRVALVLRGDVAEKEMSHVAEEVDQSMA